MALQTCLGIPNGRVSCFIPPPHRVQRGAACPWVVARGGAWTKPLASPLGPLADVICLSWSCPSDLSGGFGETVNLLCFVFCAFLVFFPPFFPSFFHFHFFPFPPISPLVFCLAIFTHAPLHSAAGMWYRLWTTTPSWCTTSIAAPSWVWLPRHPCAHWHGLK